MPPIRRLINLLVKVVDLVDEPANQVPFLVVKSKDGAAEQVADAKWTTAFVNSLPDDAFLYVQAGGEKDGEGKTVPRSLRHLPYRDKGGKVDLPHLRNALARIPQMKGVDEGTKKRLTEHAQDLLEKEGGGSTKPKEKSMNGDATQGAAQAAAAGEPAANVTASSDPVTLAKQIGEMAKSITKAFGADEEMTPKKARKALKETKKLLKKAMEDPSLNEETKAALAKAKELVGACRKSVTVMQPGPQAPFPTGAGGESPTGVTKPEGDLKPQFASTEKGFTAGTSPSGNKNIPSNVPATPPENAPPSNPPHPPVTSFPGGLDITNSVRKAAEDLAKAVEGFTKAFAAPLDKKADAAEPEKPLDKKADARGTVGPQASGEPPADDITKAFESITKSVNRLVERVGFLEKGVVGPGTKGAPEGGTDGDAAGKAVEKAAGDNFWASVVRG